ncbi:MAG: TatD family hydrolase [Bacilli bacterium]|nr:TatD family hydrolase [Bacilli bacterium]
MIDTHCHVYEEEMSNYEEIIEECSKKDISMIINAVDIKSSETIIDLSKKYKNVYAAIGLNYDTIDSVVENDLIKLEELIKKEKISAIGEIGLDYYWTKENKDKQIKFFMAQLDLAKKYDLPVIVHARDSIQDVYDIIKENGINRGSMHCYSGSLEMAKEFIKLGFKIGVDGPITYKNNKKGLEVVKNVDLKDILLETDSPYLSPEPNRGKQNSPLNLEYIVKRIAEIKEISEEEVIKTTTNNAKELFKI